MRIVEQEREALDGFVSETASTGLFPSEVLVKKINFVTGASELLATHCAGGPAANDCNFCHNFLSRQPKPAFSRGRLLPHAHLLTASEDGLLG